RRFFDLCDHHITKEGTAPMNTPRIQARAVAGTPNAQHSPALRLLAWAILKAERGQTVCQHRLQVKTAKGVV
ncbi:hypothetical protein, partial [Roseovarius sp. MMSF_3350]|uniref:hypothetical protein n=1 Tax=Roseovarius sp. MMSF_3350 TaxID=3046706 RepID=UPI00273EBDFD